MALKRNMSDSGVGCCTVERGYCVVDAGSCYVWGRTTTGQAILLDHVITVICADMGILEGQENEW